LFLYPLEVFDFCRVLPFLPFVVVISVQPCGHVLDVDHHANDIRIYTEGRIEAEMDSKFLSEAEHELKNLIENIIEKAQGPVGEIGR